MKTDFCESCNAGLSPNERLVTVYRHKGDRHFIFERVPAQVCHRCGERYFSARVVRAMDGLMKRRKQRAVTLAVHVIPLRPEA